MVAANASLGLVVWNVLTGRLVADIHGPRHAYNVPAVFDAGSKILFAGRHPNVVAVYDLATGTEKATITGHADIVLCLALSSDNKTLATANANDSVSLWDMDSKRESVLLGHESTVFTVAFSPDGKTLASGSRDCTVKLWDVTTRKEKATLNGHTARIASVAFSKDGRVLATSSADHVTKLWDTRSYSQVSHYASSAFAAFDKEAQFIATVNVDGSVQVRKIATGEELASQSFPRPLKVLAVAFPSKSRVLVFLRDGNQMKVMPTNLH
jgi:WD40 repeat protein